MLIGITGKAGSGKNGISPELITQIVLNFGTIADLHRKAQFLWNIFDV